MRAVCVSPPGARLCPARSHRYRARREEPGRPEARPFPWGSSPLPPGRRQRAAVPCHAVPCRRGALPAPTALQAQPGLEGCAKDRRGRKTYRRKTAPRARHRPGDWSDRRTVGAGSGPGIKPFPSPEGHGQRAPAPARPRHTASTPAFCVQGENSPRSSAFISRQRCINLGPLRQGSGGSSAGPAAPSPPLSRLRSPEQPRGGRRPRGPGEVSAPRCWPGERDPLRGAFLLPVFI